MRIVKTLVYDMRSKVARTAIGLCPISLDTVMEYLLVRMIKPINTHKYTGNTY